MSDLFGKIKKYTKKGVLISGLFLAIFLILFYLVNFDFSLIAKPLTQDEKSANSGLNSGLLEKLGSTKVVLGDYAEWARINNLGASNNKPDDDPDKDSLPNYQEYAYGTNPLKADSDGDVYSDFQEIIYGYDPIVPGDARLQTEITISKINATAPVVWSKTENEKDMLKDLENGVAHFAKTAMPGQIGNVIISGHSSNYFWAKGNYNYIFKNLNNLEKGDLIIFKTFLKNGRVITFNYQVTEKFVTEANDARIFEDTPGLTVTLSTCWPLGTNLRRLIIKAELQK